MFFVQSFENPPSPSLTWQLSQHNVRKPLCNADGEILLPTGLYITLSTENFAVCFDAISAQDAANGLRHIGKTLTQIASRLSHIQPGFFEIPQ